jgi:hypothetical protein
MIIDTGTPEENANSIKALIPAFVLDELPEDVSDEAAASAFAYHMIWKIQQPRKMETVRKHYIANWSFLFRLADIHPEIFDEVQAAYAERALAFDQPELAA